VTPCKKSKKGINKYDTNYSDFSKKNYFYKKFLPGVDIQSNNNLYSITMVYSIRTQDQSGMKMHNRKIAS